MRSFRSLRFFAFFSVLAMTAVFASCDKKDKEENRDAPATYGASSSGPAGDVDVPPKTAEKSARSEGVTGTVVELRQQVAGAEAAHEKTDGAERTRELLRQRRMQLADALSREGRHDEAAVQARLAVELSPESQEALFLLARVHHEKGDYIRSQTEFEKLVERNPLHSGVLYMLLGEAYLEQGNLDDAKSAFYRGLDLNPLSAKAYKMLARAYRMEGKEAEAKEQERLAEQIATTGFADRGFREKSLKEWKELAAEDPMNPLILYNIACHQEMRIEPGDYRSTKRAMMAWNYYMYSTRGKHKPGRKIDTRKDEESVMRRMEKENAYRASIKEHVHDLKKKKKDASRELGIAKIEELVKHVKTMTGKMELLENMISDLAEKAEKTGDDALAEKTRGFRTRLEAMELADRARGFNKIKKEAKSLMDRKIAKPGEVDMIELRNTYRELNKRYGQLSDELDKLGYGGLYQEVRLAVMEKD